MNSFFKFLTVWVIFFTFNLNFADFDFLASEAMLNIKIQEQKMPEKSNPWSLKKSKNNDGLVVKTIAKNPKLPQKNVALLQKNIKSSQKNIKSSSKLIKLKTKKNLVAELTINTKDRNTKAIVKKSKLNPVGEKKLAALALNNSKIKKISPKINPKKIVAMATKNINKNNFKDVFFSKSAQSSTIISNQNPSQTLAADQAHSIFKSINGGVISDNNHNNVQTKTSANKKTEMVFDSDNNSKTDELILLKKHKRIQTALKINII